MLRETREASSQHWCNWAMTLSFIGKDEGIISMVFTRVTTVMKSGEAFWACFRAEMRCSMSFCALLYLERSRNAMQLSSAWAIAAGSDFVVSVS